MSEEQIKFGPASEKQRQLLQDSTTDVILAGGGAGSGKTTCCLIKNLDSIYDPNFIGVIARESIPQLVRPGGIITESKQIYPHFGGVYKVQARTWVFPSGAQIIFAGIPDESALPEWQGSQICRLMIDEAAEWDLNRIIFLLGRIRSTRYKGKMQLIMTCNPSRTSFLYDWVKWCLDEEGVPKPGTENIIRWFVNLGGNIYWGESEEELIEKYGHLAEPEDFQPKSFRYIPMTLTDNPILQKKMPEYKANLLAQSRVNQLRFLKGSWTAKAEGEGFFKRDWVKFVDHPPLSPIKTVRAWDLAATEKSESNNDPDYTAGVKMSRDKLGNYYIEDVVRFRKSTAQVIEELIRTAKVDGIDDTEVIIPKDSGAGGAAANLFFVRTLAEQGITVKSAKISGHSGKLNRFLPFASIAEAGLVYLVKGEWNEHFLTELENFIPNNRNQKDDQVDATADAFNAISKSIQVPTFILPDTSRQSITAQLNS